MGVQVVEERPDVVLVGYDNTLTYEKTVRLLRLCAQRLPYIATHPDFQLPGSRRVCAGLGVVHDAHRGLPPAARPMWWSASGWEIIEAACARHRGARPHTCCEDRWYTDIAAGKSGTGAEHSGVTGESRREDIASAQYAPDPVLDRPWAIWCSATICFWESGIESHERSGAWEEILKSSVGLPPDGVDGRSG